MKKLNTDTEISSPLLFNLREEKSADLKDEESTHSIHKTPTRSRRALKSTKWCEKAEKHQPW